MGRPRTSSNACKRTITLSTETSTRLSIEAERRRATRSAVAESILAHSLKHIIIQIRVPESLRTEGFET